MPEPEYPKFIIEGEYQAWLHDVADGFDDVDQQCCVACGQVLLDCSKALLDSQCRRVQSDGKPFSPFPAGPVTEMIPPTNLGQPDLCVAGHVKGAKPCLLR